MARKTGIHTIMISSSLPSSNEKIEISFTALSKLADTLWYHAHSIWLFTKSDMKTIVIPKTVFGTLSACAAPAFGFDTSTVSTPSEIIRRIPLTMFWVWINLLPFDISNQRHPDSIEEDKLNKPWRVLPSGRMSPELAKKLMLCFYICAAVVSYQRGGLTQCLTLMALGFWYNDLGGSDHSSIVRNLINGLGYNCFASGATEVALGISLSPWTTTSNRSIAINLEQPGRAAFWQWVAILVVAVTTTAHAQDMHDQEGDGLRGRKTVPLVIGDLPARLTLVVSTCFWSLACARYWNVGFLSYAIVCSLALVVAVRTCAFRSVKSDKLTFLIWNTWITSIYMLPLFKIVF